tara:strand:+ start:308 stop:538 length:231 start_codon:yes stop_codon:yes gene_type:complete
MKTYDKAAMIADFLAEMSAVEEDGIKDIDRKLNTLVQACVDVLYICAETDEEYRTMLDDLSDMVYQIGEEKTLPNN